MTFRLITIDRSRVGRHAVRLVAVLAVAFGGLAAAPALVGTAAAATTINCDTASGAGLTTCQTISPTPPSCAFDNRDGSYTAPFGYLNPNAEVTLTYTPLSQTVGRKNVIVPPSGQKAGHTDNPGHIGTFPPGTSQTAFTATWYGKANGVVSWSLGSKTLSFTPGALPVCTTKPVSLVGSPLALGVGAILIISVLALVHRRRGRRAPAQPPAELVHV